MAQEIRQILFSRTVHTVKDRIYSNMASFCEKHSLGLANLPASFFTYSFHSTFDAAEEFLMLSEPFQIGFYQLALGTGLIFYSEMNRLCENAFHWQILMLKGFGHSGPLFLTIILPLYQKQRVQFLKFTLSILCLPILAAISQQPQRLQKLPSRGGKTPLKCLLTILFWAQQMVQVLWAVFLSTREPTRTQMMAKMASLTIQFLREFLNSRIFYFLEQYCLDVQIISTQYFCLIQNYNNCFNFAIPIQQPINNPFKFVPKCYQQICSTNVILNSYRILLGVLVFICINKRYLTQPSFQQIQVLKSKIIIFSHPQPLRATAPRTNLILQILCLRNGNPLSQSLLYEVFQLIYPFVTILVTFPSWQTLHFQTLECPQNMRKLRRNVDTFHAFLGVKESLFYLSDPIRFLANLRVELQVEAIFIGEIFEGVIKFQNGLSVQFQVVHVFNEGFLIRIQHSKIFLFFNHKQPLKLLHQQFEFEFDLAFDGHNFVLQLFVELLAFLDLGQYANKLSLAKSGLVDLLHRSGLGFD